MDIYPSLARAAIEPLAEQFGQSVEAMAEGILTIAVNNMANAIQTMTIRRGIDPESLFWLRPVEPVHFTHPYCPELGIPKVVMPTMPGNFAAWGMLCTDLKHDYVQTFVSAVDTADFDQITAIYRRIKTLAKGCADYRERVPSERMMLVRTADVRYLGQGHALSVSLPSGQLREDTRDDIARQFRRSSPGHLSPQRARGAQGDCVPTAKRHWRSREPETTDHCARRRETTGGEPLWRAAESITTVTALPGQSSIAPRLLGVTRSWVRL